MDTTASTVNAMSDKEVLEHTRELINAGDYGPMLKATLTRLTAAVGADDSVTSYKRQIVALHRTIDNHNEKLTRLRELLDRE